MKYASIKVVFMFIVLFSFLPFTCGQSDDSDVTFIALGHVYGDYDALNLSIPLIEKENPDFVIFLGDSLAAPDNSWDELKSFVDKISSPVYFVPGNHDVYVNGTRGNYLEKMSEDLYYNFSVGGIDFVSLNTVTDDIALYDLSYEQVGFMESIYEGSANKKIIFMHHCLFYNYDNQFCNSRPFIDNNNWNNIIPAIKENTIAVFVGDVGINEPYFGYEEDSVSYFGVGFSGKESQLKIPQHFLKVIIHEDGLTVTPIPIRQDLTKIKYFQRMDKKFTVLAKSFIKKNLAIVLKTFSIAIALLLLMVFFLSFKVLKNR